MARTRTSVKGRFQVRFLTLGKVALLSMILITVFVFSMILGMRFAVRGQVLSTPGLVGMSLSDAQDLFERIELKLVVDGRRYDLDAPEGTVVSQAPDAGVGIKVDRAVHVIVSLGRRVTSIPDLRGTSVRAARILAEQNGFSVGYVSEILGQSEDDKILDQSPLPDSTDTLTDQIDVLVQKPYHENYVMPDLTGLNLNRVLVFLKENGFESRVFYRRHPGYQRGSVVRQFPEPGYVLRQDDSINLEIAR